MDLASLHAKSCITAHGLTRSMVKDARLDGNDVVVKCALSGGNHEFCICFASAAAAERGHEALIAYIRGENIYNDGEPRKPTNEPVPHAG